MLWGCPGNKDLTIKNWCSNDADSVEIHLWCSKWMSWELLELRWLWLTLPDSYDRIYIYSVYMVEYNLVVYYNYDHITINHYFLDIGVTFLPASVGMFPEQYQWSLGSKTLRSFVALGETSGNKCTFWFMMIYDDLWWFMMVYDDFIICLCDFMNTSHNYVIVTC